MKYDQMSRQKGESCEQKILTSDWLDIHPQAKCLKELIVSWNPNGQNDATESLLFICVSVLSASFLRLDSLSYFYKKINKIMKVRRALSQSLYRATVIVKIWHKENLLPLPHGASSRLQLHSVTWDMTPRGERRREEGREGGREESWGKSVGIMGWGRKDEIDGENLGDIIRQTPVSWCHDKQLFLIFSFLSLLYKPTPPSSYGGEMK